jgi:ATP synthase protein I
MNASNRQLLPRPPVHHVLLAESGVLILLTVPAWLLDEVVGRSILLGGLIFLVPQAWFSWRVFRERGAKFASEVVQSFYRGEAGKLLLATLGFAVVFALARPLDAAALFAAYVVLHVTNAVLLIRFK